VGTGDRKTGGTGTIFLGHLGNAGKRKLAVPGGTFALKGRVNLREAKYCTSHQTLTGPVMSHVKILKSNWGRGKSEAAATWGRDERKTARHGSRPRFAYMSLTFLGGAEGIGRTSEKGPEDRRLLTKKKLTVKQGDSEGGVHENSGEADGSKKPGGRAILQSIIESRYRWGTAWADTREEFSRGTEVPGAEKDDLLR